MRATRRWSYGYEGQCLCHPCQCEHQHRSGLGFSPNAADQFQEPLDRLDGFCRFDVGPGHSRGPGYGICLNPRPCCPSITRQSRARSYPLYVSCESSKPLSGCGRRNLVAEGWLSNLLALNPAHNSARSAHFEINKRLLQVSDRFIVLFAVELRIQELGAMN